MKPKIFVALATAACLVLAGLSGSALAQAPKAKAPQKAIIGKIAKGSSGGYIIQGQKPREIFNILNPNPQVLDELVKSAKTLNIQAKSVVGVNVNIEKIDGKDYPGGKKPAAP
jgi:hypothetical protein